MTAFGVRSIPMTLGETIEAISPGDRCHDEDQDPDQEEAGSPNHWASRRRPLSNWPNPARSPTTRPRSSAVVRSRCSRVPRRGVPFGGAQRRSRVVLGNGRRGSPDPTAHPTRVHVR
jgi:hypothetical protein